MVALHRPSDGPHDGDRHTLARKPPAADGAEKPTAATTAQRAIVDATGAKLVSDNVFALELDNGSRVLALPGSDDSIRGLTVDAWIVADEAARLSEDIIAALRPMRARRPQARLACCQRRGAAPILSGPPGRATIPPGSG